MTNETDRMLRIELDGGVWLKPGAVIASRGDLAFERRPTLGAESIGDAVLREAAPLVRANGRGRLYCGSHGAYVRIIRVDEGHELVVAWKNILAFEDTLAFRPFLVEHGVGIAAGGLIAVTFSGQGSLALVVHGEPVTLTVSPGDALTTDPHATIAWSRDLIPALRMDLSWRSALGHGGHEPVQMRFTGAGFVVVEPYAQFGWFAENPRPIKTVASLVG